MLTFVVIQDYSTAGPQRSPICVSFKKKQKKNNVAPFLDYKIAFDNIPNCMSVHILNCERRVSIAKLTKYFLIIICLKLMWICYFKYI